MSGTRRSFALLVQISALLALVLSAGAAATPGGPPDEGPRVKAIVVLHDGVDARSTAQEMAQRNNGDLRFVYEHALSGFAGVFPQGRLDNMERDPRVDYVELDHEVHLAAQTTPTGIQRIFADGNSNIGIDGTDDSRVDVDVAVIDTGIDFEHPDLNVVGGTSCLYSSKGGPPWARTYTCGSGGDDDHYHGTHVAGTIGALDNGIGVVGVAPGARLWAVKVLDSSGSGYSSGIVAGIDWIVDNGAIEVANMSLGGSGFSQAEYDAIQRAVVAGVAFAVAAGNDNDDARNYSPGGFDNVLSVSALADFDGEPGGTGSPTCRTDRDDTLADFSNWGPEVDVAAPGVCIESTFPIEQGSYGTISGTSMASPHVAGALALLASSNNPGNATDVYNLYSQVTNTGNYNWNDDSGDGILEPLLDVSNTTTFEPTMVAGSGGGGGTNSPPSASFTESCTDLDCTFNGSGSTDSDGTIASFEWDFGDGDIGSGATPTHTYAADGTYSVTLTVTDDGGAADTTSHNITVSAPSGGSGGTMTVASEEYSQFGGKSRDKHLDVTILVIDGNGSGVSGATVTVDLYRDSTSNLVYEGATATTDSAGYVTFSFRDTGPGCFFVDSSASKTGWTYDDTVEPTNTSCS